MDAIGKLFAKLDAKTRKEILEIVESLSDPLERKSLRSTKLQGSDLFRVRKGRFRIIYHIEQGEAVVDAIRLRSEKTYRDV